MSTGVICSAIDRTKKSSDENDIKTQSSTTSTVASGSVDNNNNIPSSIMNRLRSSAPQRNGVVEVKWDDDSENQSSCSSCSNSSNNGAKVGISSSGLVLGNDNEKQRETELHNLHLRLLASNGVLLRKESVHTILSSASGTGCCSIEEHSEDTENSDVSFGNDAPIMINVPDEGMEINQQQQQTSGDPTVTTELAADTITSNTLKLLAAVDRLQQRRRRGIGSESTSPTGAVHRMATPSTSFSQSTSTSVNENHYSNIQGQEDDRESRLMNCILRSKTASGAAPASVAIGGEFKLGYSQQQQQVSAASFSTGRNGSRRGRRASTSASGSAMTVESVAAAFTGRGGRRRGSLGMENTDSFRTPVAVEISFSGESGAGTVDENDDPVQRAFERLRFRADRLERVRRRNSLPNDLSSQLPVTADATASFAQDQTAKCDNDDEGLQEKQYNHSEDNQNWVAFPSIFDNSDSNVDDNGGISSKHTQESEPVVESLTHENEDKKVIAFKSERSTSVRTFAKEEINFSPTGNLDRSTKHSINNKDPYAVTFTNKSLRRHSNHGINASNRGFHQNSIPNIIYEPETPYDDDTSTCISSVISKNEKLQKACLHDSEQSFEYARSPPTRQQSSRKKAFVVPQVHTFHGTREGSNETTNRVTNEITFVPSLEEAEEYKAIVGSDRGDGYQVPVPVFTNTRRASISNIHSSRCFTVKEHDEVLCDKILKHNEISPSSHVRGQVRTTSDHSIDICFVPFSPSKGGESIADGTTGEDEECPRRKELSDSSDSTLSRSRRILNSFATEV